MESRARMRPGLDALEFNVSADSHRDVVRSRGADVVTAPEDDFRFDGRVEVEGRSDEVPAVVSDFLARIVEFVGKAHREFLVEVERRFDVEHPLVFRKDLLFGGSLVVGEKRLEIASSQVEKAVVEGRFDEEGVDTVAFVRVHSPGRRNPVVEAVRALRVLDFRSESIRVGTADFLAEDPVKARGNREAFFRLGNQVETVSDKCGERMRIVFGRSDVGSAVFDFEADTADSLVLKDDRIVLGVAPIEVGESAGAISEVAEDHPDERCELPRELDAVKVERGPAVFRIAHRRGAVFVADLGNSRIVFRHVVAVRTSLDAYGNIFVEEDLSFELDILVCRIGRAEILVPVSCVIRIDIAVQFDIDSESGDSGKKDKKAELLEHSFLCKRQFGVQNRNMRGNSPSVPRSFL